MKSKRRLCIERIYRTCPPSVEKLRQHILDRMDRHNPDLALALDLLFEHARKAMPLLVGLDLPKPFVRRLEETIRAGRTGEDDTPNERSHDEC